MKRAFGGEGGIRTLSEIRQFLGLFDFVHTLIHTPLQLDDLILQSFLLGFIRIVLLG